MPVSVRLSVVLFTVIDGILRVFLKENRLPVVSSLGTSLDEEALALASHALGQSGTQFFSEQLYTFSPPTTQSGTLAVGYYFLVPPAVLSPTDQTVWVPVSSLVLGDADQAMIRYAVQRLRWKIEYTNVVYSLLPEECTLGELQKTYEAILGRELDKRNFRKKVQSLSLITPTGKKRSGPLGRGAMLYRFRQRTPVRVRVF